MKAFIAVVGFSLCGTFVYKFTNFDRLYFLYFFPYLTTYRDQTWQFL